jgi:hypothetical protein
MLPHCLGDGLETAPPEMFSYDESKGSLNVKDEPLLLVACEGLRSGHRHLEALRESSGLSAWDMDLGVQQPSPVGDVVRSAWTKIPPRASWLHRPSSVSVSMVGTTQALVWLEDQKAVRAISTVLIV